MSSDAALATAATTSGGAAAGRARLGRMARSGRDTGRRVVAVGAAVVLLLAAWETYKAVGPADGLELLGTRVLPRASDAAMPHTWTVLAVLGEPEVAVAASRTVGEAVLAAAATTLLLSLGGLALGAGVGLLLAVAMARLRVVEHGLLPWVLLSQTVPLIAVAPLVAGWGGGIAIMGRPWTSEMSVVVVAAYLAFAPVAVGALRGLQSPAPAALELFTASAASWTQTLVRLRLPASVPYLVPALRLSAAAAVVGVVVAEISTGTRGGIGRLVIEYAQQATTSPARVYAAVLGAATIGLVVAGLVALLDVALRRAREGAS
ncbi:ABC transporter permease [Pseudokineococcus sp. 1T1Z-3]|uniref:ABC transporter permease n=1 Tax=Pseudokineococcus sp. 1T1Z-3 TaxID=3132745 RepID=UPI0030AAB0A0